MEQHSVVIVDGEPGQTLGSQVRRALRPEENWQVHLPGFKGALNEWLVEHVPEVLIPVLPAGSQAAHEVLASLASARCGAAILPVVRAESLNSALDRLVTGYDEFLVSPLADAEIRVRVRRLLEGRQSHAPSPLNQRVDQACALMQIVGEAAGMLELKRKIPRAARFDSNVLLTGETGTGKERCAHALHYLSRRAGKPFVPVNCGAIPAELFESELFGHERGAFTGAHAARPGLIAEAENGTLFLDEIESLSLAIQVKLLRFLQDQNYYPVGSAKPRKADVRIVAASNVDLPARTREGQFRDDLFYRLAAITLALPPLRERVQDIPLLANHFLKLHDARHGTGNRSFSPRALSALCAWPWPGNVRELENTVLQALVFSDGAVIDAEDLPIRPCGDSEIADVRSFQRSKADAIERFERGYVSELLDMHGGNVTRAARAANKERRAFGRLVRKYEISIPDKAG